MLSLLDIGPERTVIVARSDTDAPIHRVLQVGSARIARDCFRHTPPTPRELEDAIQVVEDELEPARRILEDGSMLVTRNAATREIARVAGALPNPTSILSRDAVEAAFNRIVARSHGRTAGPDDPPFDAPTTAALLILREFMHHLGFVSITVLA